MTMAENFAKSLVIHVQRLKQNCRKYMERSVQGKHECTSGSNISKMVEKNFDSNAHSRRPATSRTNENIADVWKKHQITMNGMLVDVNINY